MTFDYGYTDLDAEPISEELVEELMGSDILVNDYEDELFARDFTGDFYWYNEDIDYEAIAYD